MGDEASQDTELWKKLTNTDAKDRLKRADAPEDAREELLYQVQALFLQGKVVGFDYTTVDDNEAYDDIDALTKEAEDAYFGEL